MLHSRICTPIGALALIAFAISACSTASAPGPRVAFDRAPLLTEGSAPLRGMIVPETGLGLTRETTSTPRRLDLKVERVWAENGATWAMVRVRNTEAFDLAKVTVACTAFGADQSPLDVGQETLLAPQEARMAPGAARTATIHLASNDVRSMSCEAHAL